MLQSEDHENMRNTKSGENRFAAKRFSPDRSSFLLVRLYNAHLSLSFFFAHDTLKESLEGDDIAIEMAKEIGEHIIGNVLNFPVSLEMHLLS